MAKDSEGTEVRPLRRILQQPHVWCFTTYFAEGFPYALIRMVSGVLFRDLGMSLEAIGLTSLYRLPWILKFLWAPQVDQFATKRSWMLSTQGILVGLFAITALLLPLGGGVTMVAALFLAASAAAATHDVAIDGYYMEALDRNGQAKYVGYRVMAYRIAMMTGTGVIVTIGATAGWPIAYGAAALLFGLVWVFHIAILPAREVSRRGASELLASAMKPAFAGGLVLCVAGAAGLYLLTSSGMYRQFTQRVPLLKDLGFGAWTALILLAILVGIGAARHRIRASILNRPDSFYSRTFLSFVDRDHIGLIVAFIIFLRTGEFLLSAMVSPFMVDLGIKIHYGWISGAVGLPASIVGAALGGFMIATYGLRRMLWPFLLAQNLTNLVYMGLAFSLSTALQTPAPGVGAQVDGLQLAAIAVVNGFDQFAGGLGTSILMTFLMRICSGEFKAAHYAIGTGLMELSGLFTGIASGFMAQRLGYGAFFGVSFLLSIPGMVLAAVLLMKLDPDREDFLRA